MTMDVALMTEGTYPHSHGGVSVWCDQLVRGMKDYTFQLVALVGTGDEGLAWPLPDNVRSVTAIPLWGQPPGGPRFGRTAARRFRPLITEFLDVLMDTSPLGQTRFPSVLKAMFEFALEEDLTAAMHGEDALRALTEAWHHQVADSNGDLTPPSVHDAIQGLQLLEHALRPLATPPVEVSASHCVANGLAVLPALTAKWVHGSPILLTEHGVYLRERYLGYRGNPYHWSVKALQLAFFRRVCVLGYTESGMIAPGNMYNARWEERLGARHEIIRTVYNGVEPDDFPQVEAEPEIPTVSWAGRVDPIKDIETLLRAFAIVHKEMPDARLRMFGGTPAGGKPYLERCEHLAAELGVADVCSFEGRVAEIRDAYVAGHVVVLSSISEGFPYTVIEAMTVGRPCVATDVGGVSEAVAETGIVVPPRDPTAMAKACLKLLADADLRTRLGAAARARVLEFFTVDRAVGTFDELYRGLGAQPMSAGERQAVSAGANQ